MRADSVDVEGIAGHPGNSYGLVFISFYRLELGLLYWRLVTFRRSSQPAFVTQSVMFLVLPKTIAWGPERATPIKGVCVLDR